MRTNKPDTKVIRGGLILDSDMDQPIRADLIVKANSIVDILYGQQSYTADFEDIDATGMLIMPGLVNAHTHSHFTVGKGLNTNWTLELHQHATSGITGGQSRDDLQILAQLAAAEMIAKGCTSCYDMVVQLPYPDIEGVESISAGYAAAGLRARIALTVADKTFWHAVPGLSEHLPQKARELVDSIKLSGASDILDACELVFKNHESSYPTISLALAPTIPMLCTPELLVGAAHLAKESGVGLHTHLAESKLQSLAASVNYGSTITSYLNSIGYLGDNLTVAHAVWIDEDDMAILAGHNVKVAHNPISNIRLGNRVASVRKMLDHGLKVGVGTDACTCSDQLNMFEAMRHASLSSRLVSDDPQNWLGARDVFKMATTNGAEIMDNQKIGKIKIGHDADLVFLDLDHVNYVPLNDALTQIVYNENGQSVQHVMIAGEFAYFDQKFVKFDYLDLISRVRSMNEERKARLSKRVEDLRAFESIVGAYCLGFNARTSTALSRRG
jgi:5-methylthioadenosine/S-adenosylhomocysteine deaminase